MKVLQVNCVYKKGSTGTLTYELHKAMLKRGIDSVVCYGRGKTIQENYVFKICPEWYSKLNNFLSRFTGFMYGGCLFSTRKLMATIKREKPDVVCLQCINGYFINIFSLITFLKNNRIPTVVVLHAEFMYTANCPHAFDCQKWLSGCGHCSRNREETKSLLFDHTAQSWEKMRRAFLGSEKKMAIVSVSSWLKNRAEISPILSRHSHVVIYNGVDTTVFHPVKREEYIKRYKSDGKKIVLHVTARFTDPNKGGRYVIQLAEELGEDYIILLIGNGIPDQDSVPNNVICIGEIRNHEDLASYYSISDVTVVTSQRETFSMICAESLCCDTPVVGFKAGGPETISNPDYSIFSEYGNIELLANNIKHWAIHKKNGRCAESSKQLYDISVMADKYLRLFEDLYSEER